MSDNTTYGEFLFAEGDSRFFLIEKDVIEFISDSTSVEDFDVVIKSFPEKRLPLNILMRLAVVSSTTKTSSNIFTEGYLNLSASHQRLTEKATNESEKFKTGYKLGYDRGYSDASGDFSQET